MKYYREFSEAALKKYKRRPTDCSAEQFQVFNSLGYQKYLEKVKKDNFKWNINNCNLQYYCQYDYQTYTHCDEGCDPYCRCGQIVEEKVTEAPDNIKFVDIYQKFFDNKANAAYFLNRLYSIRGLYKPEMYTINICGGYYGQEIESITCDIGGDLSILYCNQNNLGVLQEYLLNAEYGYIHPKLVGAKYKIVKEKLQNIKIITDHYLKINNTYDVDLAQPLGIIHNNELLDGHHRFLFANNANKKEGLFIEAYK